MVRFLLSLLVGLLIGLGVGLYLGWVQYPVQFVNSPITDLSQRYKDEYTVMVAAGYVADKDLSGAVQRLQILNIENIPNYVQQLAERFISNSRNVEDIRYLVALAERLDRLTPIMEPYRHVTIPEVSS